MKSHARITALAIALFAWTAFSTSYAQFTQRRGPDPIESDVSFIVLGETDEPPLDSRSLQGLFTYNFRMELGQKLAQLAAEEFAKNSDEKITDKDIAKITDLLVPEGIFLREHTGDDRGRSSRDNQKSSDGAFVNLRVVFDPANDLFSSDSDGKLKKLVLSQSAVMARDLMVDQVNEFYDSIQNVKQREANTLQLNLMEKKKQLERMRDELTQKHQELFPDMVINSSDLQNHYRTLLEEHRNDHIRLLGLEAQRKAIENQINSLRERQAKEASTSSALLEALKREADAMQERASIVKESRKSESAETKAAKQLIMLHMKSVERARIMVEDGTMPTSELDVAKQKLQRAELDLNMAIEKSQQKVDDAINKANAAKIDYLRQLKEEKSNTQIPTRLDSLNDMLSSLSLQINEIEAKFEPQIKLMEDLKQQIREKAKVELSQQSWNLKIERVTADLRRIEGRLSAIDLDSIEPPRKEFMILPWGN